MSNKMQNESPLSSDDAEDIWSVTREGMRTKEARLHTAKHFAEVSFDDAFMSLPESDRLEIKRRLQKLFLQQFKSPEIGEALLEETKKAAKRIAVGVVALYEPQMERSMKEYLEENYEKMCVGIARAMLADVLQKIGENFFRGLAATAHEMSPVPSDETPAEGG
jgi:hypothetical protein